MGSAFDAEWSAIAMPDLFSQFGRVVTISRDNATSTATAIPHSERMQNASGEGSRQKYVIKSWQVRIGEYNFGAGPVEPSSGDVIRDGNVDFEVYVPNGSERSWEWQDTTRTSYRIHVVER